MIMPLDNKNEGDYALGYLDGSNDGYLKGYDSALKLMENFPSVNPKTNSFEEGFEKGFDSGWNKRAEILENYSDKTQNGKIVAVSGYFDPLHIGHLEYFNLSKELGEYLVVILNNNRQCELKKGKYFMDEQDRLEIIKSLKVVDDAFIAVDKDRSVCSSLELLMPHIFANGGDRNTEEVPESKICEKLNIEMVDGLGKKIRSSSDLTGLK